MKTAWYLGHKAKDVGEAAILVGDPDRIDRIASFLDDVDFLPVKRGLRTITGVFHGKRITAASFGMGAPIATIVMSELADLGVSRFIRVGTAMYFPPASAGGFLMSEDILSFEGTSPSYCENINAASASERLNRAANSFGFAPDETLQAGTFATFDAFYRDMFPLDEASIAQVDANTEMMLERGVMAADMETSALVNAARYLDVDFTSICVATVDGQTREKLSPEVLGPRESRMFEIALHALTRD